MLEEHARLLTIGQRLLDSLLAALLLFFLCRYWGVNYDHQYQALTIISFLLCFLLMKHFNVYQPWRGASLAQMARNFTLGWFMVLCVLAILGFVSKTSVLFSRKVLLLWALLYPVVLMGVKLGTHLTLRVLRSQNLNTRTAVIAGAGELGRKLARQIEKLQWMGMNLLCFFDDHLVGQRIELTPGKTYQVQGDLDALARYVQENRVNLVYLALPLRAERRLREVVDRLRDTTASIYFVPDIYTILLTKARTTDLAGIPLISLCETPFYGVRSWLKRAEDIVLATLILFTLWPLMLVIAAGVKLTSRGPVIFKQRRYGLDGEEFLIYKFRTMTVCEDGPRVTTVSRDDPRVTRFGAFLRRTSLDELPQFFNVLGGSMSVVGPRPHAVKHNEQYRSRIQGYMLRHKVKPGLTGWAQVNGWRGETDDAAKMEQRIKYDLDYLKNWSLGFDLKIIMRTVRTVFSDPWAY
jgi:putative colanic acid biosynthesis UDP-glucose lipid carrier transferase